MSITYREYNDHDWIQLMCLAEDEWKETIQEIGKSLKFLKSEIIKTFVAFDNETLVGFVYGFGLPNGLLLPQYMYVIKDYRRHGVGEQLLKLLEKESGCNTSMIFYNTSLHDHYSKLGYDSGQNLETALKVLTPIE